MVGGDFAEGRRQVLEVVEGLQSALDLGPELEGGVPIAREGVLGPHHHLVDPQPRERGNREVLAVAERGALEEAVREIRVTGGGGLERGPMQVGPAEPPGCDQRDGPEAQRQEPGRVPSGQ